MLQDFVKKKFNDYSGLVEFRSGKTSLHIIKQSNLPAFIVNFIECSTSGNEDPVSRKEFDEMLNKAIVFNVNYIIKPKNTLLKFLFGDVETRPAEFIRKRLCYFQFYGYYVNHINDFINMNAMDVLSVNQIEHIINDINSNLLEEINDSSNGNSQRLNLVKLLYYFFVDLTDNNPINIKLPKKILSVFLADKGFTDIKSRTDSFFSDEIFIQEAIELMNPGSKKPARVKSDIDMSEKTVKEMVNKAKTNFINKESVNKDVEGIFEPAEKIPDLEKLPDVKSIRETETSMPKVEPKTLVINEEIYSNDLIFEAQFSSIIPQEPSSGKEMREILIYELFCEESYRKKIIKKLFHKNELSFKQTVSNILDLTSWNEVIPVLEKIFTKNKTDLYSEETVKFVDILQGHFTKTTVYSSQKQQGT